MSRTKSISCPKDISWEYKEIKKIGTGATAQVFLAEHPKHKQVSIKIIQQNFIKSQVGAKLIRNQICILGQISHENILKTIESTQKDGKTMIITSYYEGGDLQKYLKRNTSLDIQTGLKIFLGILDGCQYLFQKGILHRDLKPANIFLDNKKAIIADFGFATFKKNTSLMNLNVGSPLYMAPECLKTKSFSTKSEIFSLGVMIFQILTGKTPWTANSEKQLIQKMKKPPSELQITCSSQLKTIILRCLSYEAKKRPQISELKKIIIQSIESLSKIHTKQTQSQSKQIKKKEPTIMLAECKTENISLAKKNRVKSLFEVAIDFRGKQNKLVKNKQENFKKTQHTQLKIAKNQKSSKVDIGNNRTEKSKTQYISCENKNKAKIDLHQIIFNIKASSFTFLPESLIRKLQIILTQYTKIIKQTNHHQNEKQVPLKQCQTFEQEKDQLIKEVLKCSNEKQICLVIEGFIRRLYRLTKNYKGYQNQLIALDKFHKVVISNAN